MNKTAKKILKKILETKLKKINTTLIKDKPINNLKLLITISSKNPSKYLLKNIENIQNCFYMYPNKKICIIDSNSDNLNIYDIIKKKYPLIYEDIEFVKNKNYEYGAYKLSYFKYPDYDVYCCIQDSLILNSYIDLSLINDNTAFTYCEKVGFNTHKSIKNKGIELLNNVKLDYEQIIHTDFNLATHCSFIVSCNIMKDIYETLTNPPLDKKGSCCYERLFGLYFILKKINIIKMQDFFTKFHFRRY